MDIDRDTYENVGPNDIDVRIYDLGDDSLPSVTSVLKTREQDKSNLYDWKDRNDGTGDAADHNHLFWYSRNLGTLGHWAALSQLDDLEWSQDEQDSFLELYFQTHDDVEEASAREILYSVLRGDKNKGGAVLSWGEFYDKYPPYKGGQYYTNQLAEQAHRDVNFFAGAQKRLWNKLDIEQNDVIAVEQMLFNKQHGYAGQVDLVYEDVNGHTVVADLKSSSGCYRKHQLQGAAYAKAIELSDVPVNTVDRLEVHRTHPRSGQMVVHTHNDAPGQQPIHTTKYWNDGYDELWNDFKQLADNFTYDEPDRSA